MDKMESAVEWWGGQDSVQSMLVVLNKSKQLEL